MNLAIGGEAGCCGREKSASRGDIILSATERKLWEDIIPIKAELAQVRGHLDATHNKLELIESSRDWRAGIQVSSLSGSVEYVSKQVAELNAAFAEHKVSIQAAVDLNAKNIELLKMGSAAKAIDAVPVPYHGASADTLDGDGEATYERLQKAKASSQEQAASETNGFEPSNSRFDLLESRIAALEANPASAYPLATASCDAVPVPYHGASADTLDGDREAIYEPLQKAKASSQEQAASETNGLELSTSLLHLLESRIAALEANPASAYPQATASCDAKPSDQLRETAEKDLDIPTSNATGSEDPINQVSRSIEPSCWEILLFVDLKYVSHSASFLLVLSSILNIVLQGLFVSIVYEEFTPFPDQLGNDAVDAARKWRLTDAHSPLTMDTASWTSLAARVCQMDGTLISSTHHVGLLGDIQAYLKLSFMFPDSFAVRTGPLLYCVVLVVWLTLIAGEIRQVLEYIMAILALPRGGVTDIAALSDGSFQICAINTMRVYAVTIASLLRLVVAVVIGYIGALWLSRTASLTDLVLNAAAMAFIFDLDDLLYASLAPVQVQALLDNLQPFDIPWRIGCCLRFWPYVVLVSIGLSTCIMMTYETDVMTGRMIQVRYELCERGTLDFVLGRNDLEGVVLAASTVKVSDEVDASTNTVLRHAAAELMELQAFENADLFRAQEKHSGIIPEVPNPNPWPALLVRTKPAFESYSVSIPELQEYPTCLDTLDNPSPTDRPGMRMAVQSLTLSAQVKHGTAARSCLEISSAETCMLPSGQDIRSLCSMSCGCASPRSNLYVAKTGCLPACLAERWEGLEFLACKDVPGTQLFQNPGVLTFIKYWENQKVCAESLTDALLELGCQLFTGQSIVRLNSICGGNAGIVIERVCGLGAYLAPYDPMQLSVSSLRPWCPVSCGCIQKFSTDCPQDCANCNGDASACPSKDLDPPTCAGGLCRGSALLPEKLYTIVTLPSWGISAACLAIHLQFKKVSESECAAMRSSPDLNIAKEICCAKG